MGINKPGKQHGFFSHKDCDHETTREARQECRDRMKREDPERFRAMSKPSMNPKRVRDRARYHAERAADEVAQVWKPVEDWDIEELAHGRPRSADGSFSGRALAIIPREVHDEAIRRFRTMLESKVREVSAPAVQVLHDVMQDPETPPATSASIAQYLLDRVLGKPTTHLEADVHTDLTALLASFTVNPGESEDEARDAHAIVDVEPIEMDDDEYDPTDRTGIREGGHVKDDEDRGLQY